jgi:hypothetical protein
MYFEDESAGFLVVDSDVEENLGTLDGGEVSQEKS